MNNYDKRTWTVGSFILLAALITAIALVVTQ